MYMNIIVNDESLNLQSKQQIQAQKMPPLLTNILQIWKWNQNLTEVLLYVCMPT